MKKVLKSLAVAGFLAGAVNATEINLNLPVEVHGGFSAGYSYEDSKKEGFEVTNFLIEISKEASIGEIGFVAAFGYLANNAINPNLNASLTGDNFGFQYGYLTIKPVEGLTLDAGVLTTLVGYEVANTYANPNITISTQWAGQPVYYGGARLTYDIMENISVFGEINDDAKDGAWSIGSFGSLDFVDYVVSYYDKNNSNETDIFDVILSKDINDNLSLATDFDYQIGKNNNGYALAIYVIPKFGVFSLPVRFEIFDANNSGIYYKGNKGWDIAITPTYNFKHGYIRAEVFYYDYDQQVAGGFTTVKDKGYAGDKSNTVFRVEAGYTF